MRSRGTSGATPPARFRRVMLGVSVGRQSARPSGPTTKGTAASANPSQKRPGRVAMMATPSASDTRPQSAGSGVTTHFVSATRLQEERVAAASLPPVRTHNERTRRIPSTRRASRKTRRAPSVTSCRRSHSVRKRAVKTVRTCAIFAHHSSCVCSHGRMNALLATQTSESSASANTVSSSSTATCIGDNESQWYGTIMTESATTSAVRSTMRARTASAT
jgi:hypothetical protein